LIKSWDVTPGPLQSHYTATSRSNRKESLQQKHQRPQKFAFYSCKTSTHRSRSDTTEGFRSIENKKFATMMYKNKPRSNLRDAKQRAGEIRSTYPCRSHSANIQMNLVGVVILASPPCDPIQSKHHNGRRLRALHTYSNDSSSSSVQQGVVEW
jgi:hypothetical protein